MSVSLHSLDMNTPIMARAIVRANNDPDKLGRIKVEYPWFHSSTAQIPSEWARICMPYASKESGSWFVPENGDEVLVFFENGNLDYPIVLGTLYSGKNTPPKSGRSGDLNDNNQNNLKFLKTRAGHLICFDDSSEGGIVIQASGNEISVLSEGSISIKNKSGDKIELKGGEVTIHSSGKINLGEGAMHPIIFGDLFQQIFNAHTHSTAVGTSSPPATPMTPDMLSQKVKSY